MSMVYTQAAVRACCHAYSRSLGLWVTFGWVVPQESCLPELPPCVHQGTPEALEAYGQDLLGPMLELCIWATYFGADRHAIQSRFGTLLTCHLQTWLAILAKQSKCGSVNSFSLCTGAQPSPAQQCTMALMLATGMVLCLIRLYREWAELHGSLLVGRPHPPNQDERRLLRAQGRKALDTLLSVIKEELLPLYVAQENSVLEVRNPLLSSIILPALWALTLSLLSATSTNLLEFSHIYSQQHLFFEEESHFAT